MPPAQSSAGPHARRQSTRSRTDRSGRKNVPPLLAQRRGEALAGSRVRQSPAPRLAGPRDICSHGFVGMIGVDEHHAGCRTLVRIVKLACCAIENPRPTMLQAVMQRTARDHPVIIGRNVKGIPTEIVDSNQLLLRRLETGEQLGCPAKQSSDFDNRPAKRRGPRALREPRFKARRPLVPWRSFSVLRTKNPNVSAAFQRFVVAQALGRTAGGGPYGIIPSDGLRQNWRS